MCNYPQFAEIGMAASIAQVQPKFADDDEVPFLDSEKGRFGSPNGWKMNENDWQVVKC